VTLRWGAFVPQGWKLEYDGVAAADAWARSMSIAAEAEAIGYDHLWVYDHVETVPHRKATHVFEAWTTMAALSQVTTRARLGQLVTCAAYRNAGMLAKQAACVDVTSGGRLIFGIGAGWYEREYLAYGWPFPRPGVRLDILDETLRAVRLLWDAECATFAGTHVQLDGAYCDPKPLQSLPPIWVGGGGERRTLRIAAEHADATNWQIGIDAFVHKSKVLREHCDDLGRDFDSITRTLGPDCILFDTEADMRAWFGTDRGGHLWGRVPPNEYARDNFVGTVDQVAERVRLFVDAGAREFVLWFRDYPSTESLRRFMAEVVPLVGTGLGPGTEK
jgi:F420-dependent oxidoreductase-like protein